MDKITIIREKNFMTMHRPFKVFINDEFIDYIEPKEKNKIINLPNSNSFRIRIGVNNCSSNSVYIDNSKDNLSGLQFNVTSQVQNGLFIFIFITFFGGLLLRFFNIIENTYLAIALTLPFSIIVYWQTIGKNKYLRLTKK